MSALEGRWVKIRRSEGDLMGIQELEVKGFRSLRGVHWTPGRVNVLIRTQWVGKSNLLQVLSLIQKAAQGQLSEEILKHGGILPLVWDSREEIISWHLTRSGMELRPEAARA
jgi:predicted ATPase